MKIKEICLEVCCAILVLTFTLFGLLCALFPYYSNLHFHMLELFISHQMVVAKMGFLMVGMAALTLCVYILCKKGGSILLKSRKAVFEVTPAWIEQSLILFWKSRERDFGVKLVEVVVNHENQIELVLLPSEGFDSGLLDHVEREAALFLKRQLGYSKPFLVHLVASV